jgi:hypothetical protein
VNTVISLRVHKSQVISRLAEGLSAYPVAVWFATGNATSSPLTLLPNFCFFFYYFKLFSSISIFLSFFIFYISFLKVKLSLCFNF